MISKLKNNTTIFYSLLFLTAVSLLMPDYSLVSKLLILLGIYALFFYGNSNEKKKLLLKHKWAFLSVSSLFLLTFFGMIYTDNRTEAWKEIILKLPFLFLPVIIFSEKINNNTLLLIHKYFSITVLLVSFVSLCEALYVKFSGWGDYLFYHEFSLFTHKHPTYYGLFLVLAFLYFYHLFFIEYNKRFLALTAMFFLMVMLYINSNRISFFALFVSLMIYTLPKLNKKNTLLFLGFIVFGFALLFQTPYLQNRIKPKYFAGNGINDYSLRRKQWKSVLETIKHQNIILGKGTEGNRNYLYQKYLEKGLKTAYINKYNAHNQFLEILLDYGLIGLFIFLWALYYQCRLILNSKNYYYVSIYFAVIIFMLTESILERQNGIIIYALFISIIMQHILLQNTKKQ